MNVITLLLPVMLLSAVRVAHAQDPEGLTGRWLFDDPQDLTAADVGADLVLAGTDEAVEGMGEGDGATRVGVGSYYIADHGIPPNGGGVYVNQYSVVVDLRLPAIGVWYSLMQTNESNTNDGDWWISPGGAVGVGATGYSAELLQADTWYRLVLSVELGDGPGAHHDYYLDGLPVHRGMPQELDGRFCLDPTVLFLADQDGEDSELDVSSIWIFDRALSDGEAAALSGVSSIQPYLQSPTPESIYIGWHSAAGVESRVDWGVTDTLGNSSVGSVYQFDGDTWWHSVHLTDLQPGTKYHYRCVTGDEESALLSFNTLPPEGEASRLRYLVLGDTRTDAAAHEVVILAMCEKMEELYGPDYQDSLTCVINVGDIVTTGSVLSQYTSEYFMPIRHLSGRLPFMVSIGNHEGENWRFYEYMEYDEAGGTEGERYYCWQAGRTLFISLNSNTRGQTQLDWLEGVLQDAQDDPDVDWITATLHHPGRSEVWPDGNTDWVQNSVMPLLAQFPKADQLIYGHSHNYERGAVQEGNLRLMLSGGGGSALDRWGMYANQQDYPEIHRSLDHYCYNLFDVDEAAGVCEVETWSLGHPDLPLDNESVDSYRRIKTGATPPDPPLPLDPGDPTDYPVLLEISAYAGSEPQMSSRFQLRESAGGYEAALLNVIRDYENVYGDTGAPDWQPVDLNAGIDLVVLEVYDPAVTGGGTFFWRARNRDRNLQWSDWGPEQEIQVAAPQIDVDPLNVLAILLPDSTVGRTLTVSNLGAGNLFWSARVGTDRRARGIPGLGCEERVEAGWNREDHGTPVRPWNNSRLVQACLPVRDTARVPSVNDKSRAMVLPLGKGAVDPRPGAGPERDAGGPDAYGYSWVDSDQASGPVFEWQEISGIGQDLGNADDANYGPYSLGFDFPYYGTMYEQVRICTNGWLSFTSTATDYTNQQIPSTAQPNALLAPFWDDLHPGEGGEIYYYQDTENQRFIVQYHQVQHYGGGNPETFQMALDASGGIRYQYLELSSTQSCTVGIESPDGTDGLQVVFNSTYLHDSLAVVFGAGPAWLQVDPVAGLIQGPGSEVLQLNFDAADLETGEYHAVLHIDSNDPGQPDIQVPVVMSVVEPGQQPVEDLGIEYSDGQLILSWTALPGALAYRVYQSEQPYGSFEFVEEVQTAYYSFTQQQPRMFYMVTAVY